MILQAISANKIFLYNIHLAKWMISKTWFSGGINNSHKIKITNNVVVWHNGGWNFRAADEEIRKYMSLIYLKPNA